MGGSSSSQATTIGPVIGRGDPTWTIAGLDISMDETHVCVLDCEGVVIHESKAASTAEAIAGELAKAQVVVASYSRRDEWRQSSSTCWANSAFTAMSS
jgi:hypothetical protein